MTFQDLNLNTPLYNALDDLGFASPTPIQVEAFNVVSSGKDMVGIAQTGTGKTFAYMLPILKNLKFSEQETPRILVLVPTRELVVQVVSEIEKLAKYINVRVLGVYGGTNINTQKQDIAKGLDILVATPGRFYDLALSRVLQLKNIQRLVIDEVDVMLDLGFRHQLINIFDILPERRQNIMFSATMTHDVDVMISEFFKSPERVSIAVSGTPLENILQQRFNVPNFYTKVNLLNHVLQNTEEYNKVLIFIGYKKLADLLFENLDETFPNQCCVIHSNKTQNYRLRSIEQFRQGDNRILVATDVMARGLDIDNISHVINFDTPDYPENYMHRIGRTGRAEREGISLLFSTEKELESVEKIESLMKMVIPLMPFPETVAISEQLTEEERPQIKELHNPIKKDETFGPAFHEKIAKNKKENLGGSYKFKIAEKYKKPKTRGDKNYNKRNKKK
ncbi:MAG: DEAD/DEAH box helicase [Flavobacteriales bacterium]|nr:DEAD/DEAH box helicase [Flavobacteriia bacterium]NCP05281.1 DEAD/DEAH box helicase [Flavobacteriales bacterium]PIV95078.1 MAG: DEAD/DEAH box helicase [Flavobacteriaceae bacterium CG17_big_fil_post_rev_8_21_14_2_50_33_15]PIY09302.1 MAG: DEAD/DEAH box helicase [Flavobacteriaceae bacterium CG_4_10_14_3_um_filter_33_47]PJB20276.1 MAG: DEAD/DEAH box helicase [Flavobacteriaceae bacterium CG_4_9_14_3_um_filter_33_16]